ncbi:hypothetical protein F4805DRAFT_442517 [Annulohypoxylon moriforme]|nr:hypothetical protein F4805DRAFT_442517 [Annulohypoxylon moriforme]
MMMRVNNHPKGKRNRTTISQPEIIDLQPIQSQTAALPQITLPLRRQPTLTLSVLEILEAAREGSDTTFSPELELVLKRALRDVWEKILDSSGNYVMTRDEFALFNFFQHLKLDEEGTEIARRARQHYWNNVWGTPSK